MVKFGRHVDVFQENDNAGTGLFVVPYNDIKLVADKRDVSLNFEACWRQQLDRATRDFQRAISSLWNDVFDKIAHHAQARGALPSVAMTLYAQEAGTKAARELLIRLKQVHEAATTNSEALRKLVKKHDKHSTTDQQLSPTLVPLIYTSNFELGRSMLLDSISLLRDLLEQNDGSSSSSSDNDDVARHEQVVRGRQTELEWLQRLTRSMEPDELERLVAHRGFHSPQDYSHRRPIENSLTAYETAWTNGIHLCECDIALTKDEKIILAHDKDFSRLALNQTSPKSNRRVADLTLKELMALPLLSIARPPLLLDVLRSAHAIGENAQLVIEIKPGNEAAATACARMLLHHPELVPCIHIIMSFDAYTIHKLRQELRATPSPKQGQQLLSNSAVNRRQEDSTKQAYYPKLMLLTVADPPKKPCELQVGVEDLSRVDSWIKSTSSGTSLDGVYLQFQKTMLEAKGLAALQELSQRYCIGVWGHAGKDPDDYVTFSTLVHEANVHFVNTDLPRDFRKGIVVQNEGE